MSSRFALGLLALCAASAGAQTQLTATMTNNQEVGPTAPGPANPLLTSTGGPRPISFGTATFTINAAMTSMTFSATVNNIDVNGMQTPNDTNDNLAAAHIHAPAPPGMNAGVVWGFFGMPFHDTSPTNTVVTPFGPGSVGGTFAGTWDAGEGSTGSFASQLSNILAGLSYINFHTSQFGGGEIRGQIVVVPEPETYALMLAGLGVLGAWARRGRRGSNVGAPSGVA